MFISSENIISYNVKIVVLGYFLNIKQFELSVEYHYEILIPWNVYTIVTKGNFMVMTIY